MLASYQTALRTLEPDDPPRSRPKTGAVHRLGTRTTVRLAANGPAPVAVFISGEIDLTCADQLAALLCATLDAYPQGTELDLTSVSFCDCSGLRALMTARAAAQRHGRHFALGAHSRIVGRVLELTGSWSMLTV